MNAHRIAARDDRSAAAAIEPRRVAAALARLEGCLRELARVADARALKSPLPAHRADLTPLQRQVLAEGSERLQARIAEVMQRHRVTAPPLAESALQACRRVLHEALVAVDELAPRRGDPRLADEAEAELRRSVALLLEPIDEMLRALAPHEEQARAAGIDEELATLRRIVRAHGLSRFEAPLAALAERAADRDFMVAVLGRANAGKSSLINRLLATKLLPVAATPATAVPVQLRHGLRPRGLARFADAAPDVFTPERLAEFAAERYNAGNARHVERLVFELPAPRLAGGVCLVDTPAWSEGAALPPCDLGLVLVDATGSLALDEAALVDELRSAGAEVVVLLSKADRLGDEERWQVYGHVAARLKETPLFLASSTSGDPALRDDWVVRGLEPCIARRAAIRQASLQAKTRRWREEIARSLESRGEGEGEVASIEREGLALIDAARSRVSAPAAEARLQASRLLREVAHNAAELGRRGGEALPLAPLVAASLEARLGAARHDAVRELRLLAARCADLLAETTGPGFEWRLPLSSLPAFDASTLPTALDLPRSWRTALGAWALRGSARRALQRQRVPAAAEAWLCERLTALERWREVALDELHRAFAAACDARGGEAARIAADLASLRGGG